MPLAAVLPALLSIRTTIQQTYMFVSASTIVQDVSSTTKTPFQAPPFRHEVRLPPLYSFHASSSTYLDSKEINDRFQLHFFRWRLYIMHFLEIRDSRHTRKLAQQCYSQIPTSKQTLALTHNQNRNCYQ